MSSKTGFKIWGPTYGYEKEKGAYVFALSYSGDDDKTRKELLKDIKRAEDKHKVKISIMGVGEKVQGPLRELAKQYMQPEWKVPPMQINFGFPAGEITQSPEVDDTVQPASPPPARKQPAKRTQAKPAAKNKQDEEVIQEDMWNLLKKLGG